MIMKPGVALNSIRRMVSMWVKLHKRWNWITARLKAGYRKKAFVLAKRQQKPANSIPIRMILSVCWKSMLIQRLSSFNEYRRMVMMEVTLWLNAMFIRFDQNESLLF